MQRSSLVLPLHGPPQYKHTVVALSPQVFELVGGEELTRHRPAVATAKLKFLLLASQLARLGPKHVHLCLECLGLGIQGAAITLPAGHHANGFCLKGGFVCCRLLFHQNPHVALLLHTQSELRLDQLVLVFALLGHPMDPIHLIVGARRLFPCVPDERLQVGDLPLCLGFLQRQLLAQEKLLVASGVSLASHAHEVRFQLLAILHQACLVRSGLLSSVVLRLISGLDRILHSGLGSSHLLLGATHVARLLNLQRLEFPLIVVKLVIQVLRAQLRSIPER
mmetsp:Transcript_14997/g.35371  ORF Transcript_14997/g.35371 Transcript_14997/m.35371 type:complete len:279 (+) Transcript_14997:1062-1898(+)